MKSKIIIGTRSSNLALWQVNYVRAELQKIFPQLEITLKKIKTKGDHITDVSLSKVEGKGFFTKEIEDCLLKKEIDLAVHSLKDLPTKLPSGLMIGAVLKREGAHDALMTRKEAEKSTFRNLPTNSKIGTSSLRRIAQLKAMRSDLEYLDLRGNLDTRIRKLDEGKYDAIVVAYAGVKRLGFENRITEHFNPKEILPAVGQGSMAIEIREDDNEIKNIVSGLNDENSYLMSVAERAFLEMLQGGCQVPIGAYSEIKDKKITLYGMIAGLDGKQIVRDKATGSTNEPKKIGIKLAEMLLQNGGREILQ